MKKYPVKYTDKSGREESFIFSDGSNMFLTLRGIKFEGPDFEMLEGKVNKDKFQYNTYQDGSGDLTNFRIEILFPLKIVHENKIVSGKIKFLIDVGEITDFEISEPDVNTVELVTSFGNFKSDKQVKWFENSIIEIQNMLPETTQIKTCLSCKYSNYHPVGNGMFGSLYCFKKIKEKLQSVHNKHDLMKLWSKEAVDSGDIFNVQEIFDCDEHKFISLNDWNYKDWAFKTNCTRS